jgi:hypothetical protein
MKQLRVGKPFTINEITVIPLEEDRVIHSREGRWLSCYMLRMPVGIVVTSHGENWACDISGDRMPLATLVQQFDGLQELLDDDKPPGC